MHRIIAATLIFLFYSVGQARGNDQMNEVDRALQRAIVTIENLTLYTSDLPESGYYHSMVADCEYLLMRLRTGNLDDQEFQFIQDKLLLKLKRMQNLKFEKIEPPRNHVNNIQYNYFSGGI